MDSPSTKYATREQNKKRIRVWRKFLTWVDNHSDSRWIFRGLGDERFDLIPSVGRTKYYEISRELSILTIFKNRFAEFNNNEGLSNLDILAIAQHHGVPTRLLDWTTNPLAAAYFAVTSAPGEVLVRQQMPNGRPARASILATPTIGQVNARIVAHHVKSSTVIDGRTDPFSIEHVSLFWPRSVTARISSQGGLFSVHGNPAVEWNEPLEVDRHRFDIPGPMRAFFRRRLFYLGLDPQRIMGGLDGIGARIAWQYQAAIGLGSR